MIHLLRQLETSVRVNVGRVRTWFDPPIGADAEPLEVRQAIIEHVERQVEPAGQGRRVLPHNHVTVVVLATDKEERARLQAVLADVADGIRGRLREIRCDVPAPFAVDLQFLRRPPAAWSAGQRLQVAYDSRQSEQAPQVPVEALTLTVTVTRGLATQPSYVLGGPVIRIGRTAAPVDSRGRPRANHIAFREEDGDEHSRTVGRAHASIRYQPDRREYRLFDEGSHNGTRIVRNSTTLEVVARDPVGVALVSGDQVEFGTAAVRIEIGPTPVASPPPSGL